MKIKNFTTEEEVLSSKIIDTEPVEGIRLLTLKRGTGVVTLRGSMLGGDIYSTKNNRTADMVAAMLDQGTTNMSKFEISKKLESEERAWVFSTVRQGLDLAASFCRKTQTW